MGILDFIFRHRKSGRVARDRLKLVLMQDRSSLPPALLEALQAELVRVISKHVRVKRDDLMVTVEREGKHNLLVINVPFSAPKRQGFRQSLA